MAAGHDGSSLMIRNRLSAREPDVFSRAFEPVRTNSENSTKVRAEFAPRAEFGLNLEGMDRLGFEPRASCLQSRRSSADLPARPRVLSVAPRMKLSAFVGGVSSRGNRSSVSDFAAIVGRFSSRKTFSIFKAIRTERKA